MTMMDTGVTGAKRQSWKEANPRELLKRLAEDNPSWSKERLFQAFVDQVMGNKGYLDTIVEYWFANNFHSLLERPSNANERARSSRVEGIKANLAEHITRHAEMLLLEMQMPNGKPLRDCTGAECLKLSSAVGGWLLRVSKRIGSDQTVGSALTENEVREMFDKST